MNKLKEKQIKIKQRQIKINVNVKFAENHQLFYIIYTFIQLIKNESIKKQQQHILITQEVLIFICNTIKLYTIKNSKK